MNQLSTRDLDTHVPIVGWLLLVGHILFLLLGIFLFVLLTGIGAISGDHEATAILVIVGTIVGGLMVVLALPGILAGYGLLKRRNWGRVLAVVVSILNLLNFPLGTVIGVYSLWVLMQNSASDYFASAA
jgi:hypothetical protein